MSLLKLKSREVAVVFRLGVVNRVVSSGWFWTWPVLESFVRVSLESRKIALSDVELQISKTQKRKVDISAEYKVTDAMKSVTNIEDVHDSVVNLIKTAVEACMVADSKANRTRISKKAFALISKKPEKISQEEAKRICKQEFGGELSEQELEDMYLGMNQSTLEFWGVELESLQVSF